MIFCSDMSFRITMAQPPWKKKSLGKMHQSTTKL